MSSVFFFSKKKVFLKKIFSKTILKKNFLINNIKPLHLANQNDLSFFDKLKYKDYAKKTNAGACITTEKLKIHLPKKTQIIIVKNVLYVLATTLKKIYPLADIDYPDSTLTTNFKKKYKFIKFGKNVLIGKNVKIGKSTVIGPNTIIEHDVILGKNCVVGSNVIIKNSIIGDRVVLQDNCKIGLKGFGFIPLNNKNIKFPHIGRVVIEDDTEIGSGCTIDRGSVDDTHIGKNTYLDNQVHLAHNVKIGSNCMIAGQVGFAGSCRIGNNVSIGGQAGISGHLVVGDNVKIGGGTGVIKDIGDNQVVMGYPAMPLKYFLKK
jgi:UDP-3-O-[3-hydroxymyristoyl] glucosamine N-acyltransferase